MDLNLRSAFFAIQAALPYLRQRGGGSVVNLASIAGRSGFPHISPQYSAAKGGIVSLTQNLASRSVMSDIRVNAVAPGYINSGPRVQQIWDSRDTARRSWPPSHSAGGARPKRWPPPSSSWPRTPPPTSPGRPLTSTAASSRGSPAVRSLRRGWNPVEIPGRIEQRARRLCPVQADPGREEPLIAVLSGAEFGYPHAGAERVQDRNVVHPGDALLGEEHVQGTLSWDDDGGAVGGGAPWRAGTLPRAVPAR